MQVAIIGCSFSDSWYNPNNYTESLAKLYPKIKFFNYAKAGRGHLYMDMCLKHCLFVEKYDLILIQLTGRSRWQTPCGISESDDTDIRPWESYEQVPLRHNYTLMRPTEAVNTIIQNESPKSKDKGPLRTSYSGLFYKQLDVLSKTYPIFYYSFPDLKFGVTNNIGQEYDVFSWFENRFGERIFIEKCLDDTDHLNLYGNKLLLEEYILSSKIKIALDNLITKL